MKWHSAWLAILGGISLAAVSGCSARTTVTPCPVGNSQYRSSEVALRLDFMDDGGSYRLPLGKVVVAPGNTCASGDPVEVLGSQLPPRTPAPFLGDYSAFRAGRTGTANIYQKPCSGGACGHSFAVDITVTNGCQPLSRTDAISRVTTRYPTRSLPDGSGDGANSAKLVLPSEYEKLFGTSLDLAPDSLVWAVLVGIYSSPEPSPPLRWTGTAVGACTDWISRQWMGMREPPGWSSVTDQGPPPQ